MKILIGGDVYCFSSKKDIPKVLLSDKLLKKIKTTDYFIVNLEGPITNSNNKNEKIGIHLKNPIKLAESLKRIKVNVVGIANNHIMDFGKEGRRMKKLKQSKESYSNWVKLGKILNKTEGSKNKQGLKNNIRIRELEEIDIEEIR